MYDPRVGQFLEEDPIGFDAGDENLRRYVRNNPLSASDPTGLQDSASWSNRPIIITSPFDKALGVNPYGQGTGGRMPTNVDAPDHWDATIQEMRARYAKADRERAERFRKAEENLQEALDRNLAIGSEIRRLMGELRRSSEELEGAYERSIDCQTRLIEANKAHKAVLEKHLHDLAKIENGLDQIEQDLARRRQDIEARLAEWHPIDILAFLDPPDRLDPRSLPWYDPFPVDYRAGKYPPTRLPNGAEQLKYEVWFDYGLIYTKRYPVRTLTFIRHPWDTTNYDRIVETLVAGLQDQHDLEACQKALTASMEHAVYIEIILLFRTWGKMYEWLDKGGDWWRPDGGGPECPTPPKPPAAELPKPNSAPAPSWNAA
jgi:tetratricopeptide (TPR) repeat protein